MDQLTDRFSQYVLLNPNENIIELYNKFLYTVSDEEAKKISNNFMLFIKVGQWIRSSPYEIQKKFL